MKFLKVIGIFSLTIPIGLLSAYLFEPPVSYIVSFIAGMPLGMWAFTVMIGD